MILKNRVVATEGVKEKDGIPQDYKFNPNLSFSGDLLTWGHPPNDDLTKADVVGRFINPRIKDGKLVVDLDIDESKMSPDRWWYLWSHPDASIGYYYRMERGADGKLIREILEVNHIAIGIEEGVCSTPICGLATTADSARLYATDNIQEAIIIANEDLNKFIMQQQEASALQQKINELQGQLKAAQDEACELKKFRAEVEERERQALIQELVTKTGQDAAKFSDKTLAMLKEFRELLPVQTPPPSQGEGTITLTAGGDGKPNGMPQKATISYYGAPWREDKPKDYVL